MYATDRSKAVVPMLLLFYVALSLHYEALRVLSCPALCLCVSSVVLAFDHLAWASESWSLCLPCTCLLAIHT